VPHRRHQLSGRHGFVFRRDGASPFGGGPPGYAATQWPELFVRCSSGGRPIITGYDQAEPSLRAGELLQRSPTQRHQRRAKRFSAVWLTVGFLSRSSMKRKAAVELGGPTIGGPRNGTSPLRFFRIRRPLRRFALVATGTCQLRSPARQHQPRRVYHRHGGMRAMHWETDRQNVYLKTGRQGSGSTFGRRGSGQHDGSTSRSGFPPPPRTATGGDNNWKFTLPSNLQRHHRGQTTAVIPGGKPRAADRACFLYKAPRQTIPKVGGRTLGDRVAGVGPPSYAISQTRFRPRRKFCERGTSASSKSRQPAARRQLRGLPLSHL